tara:strand:- start:24 stop:242 length:219 start_codon:yes stop_codon:yes gene_type:complete
MGMTKSILIIIWIREMVLEPAYEYANVFELALCWFVNLMILVLYYFFRVSSFSTLVKQVKSSIKIYQQVPDT